MMLQCVWGLLGGLAVAGTPWIHPRGEAYTKLSEQRFTSRDFVAPDGTRQAGAQYVGWMTALYAEVGVGHGVQLMASVPWIGSRNVVEDAAFIQRGVGDAVVGVSFGRAPHARVPVAVTTRIKVPLYDNAEVLALGPAGGRFPALGDGQVDVDVVGSVGTGIALGPLQGWWLADAGLRHRSEWWLGDASTPDRRLGDGVIARAQLGWAPAAHGRSLGWLFVESALVKAFRTDGVTRQTWDVAGGGAVRIGHRGWALELGGSATVWAEAAAPGWASSAGISWQRARGSARVRSGG